MKRTEIFQRVVRPATCIALLGALSLGCVALVPYSREDDLAEHVGREGVESELADLLIEHTVAPRVLETEFRDNSILLHVDQQFVGPYGIPVGSAAVQKPLAYRTLSKIEVYENHKVWFYGPSGHMNLELLFDAPESAVRCAQLVHALQAAAGGTPAQGGDVPAS